jgi:L-fucose isomerase-like protein
MSMMSEKLMPSACEVDVAGTVAMYALQLASGRPSALVERYICRHGFEHHAAMNASHCGEILAEAMEVYLGWTVHRHS